VVILGSGFGGLHAAQALAGIDMAGAVIDPRRARAASGNGGDVR
jgi:NADH dehydrogenase FAD-containing subunit